MTNSNKESSRLIEGKNSYLLQHAYSHSPIDWYPWSGAAFDNAKAGDKPIFLSIAYFTWH